MIFTKCGLLFWPEVNNYYAYDVVVCDEKKVTCKNCLKIINKEDKMVNIKEVNIEEVVEDFIKDLQWDLRASYNSSSCLGSKQRDFLKEKLYNLLIVLQEEL